MFLAHVGDKSIFVTYVVWIKLDYKVGNGIKCSLLCKGLGVNNSFFFMVL